jgi:hypothetical protein
VGRRFMITTRQITQQFTKEVPRRLRLCRCRPVSQCNIKMNLHCGIRISSTQRLRIRWFFPYCQRR